MKLGLMADLHARLKPPRGRIDDWVKTMQDKFDQILDICESESVEYVLVAGDVFDSSTPSFYLISKTICDLFNPVTRFRVVAGQHDMPYHSKDLTKTALWMLKMTGNLNLMEDCDFTGGGKVSMYGCSWKQKIPTPKREDDFNILVIHKFLSDQDYWNGGAEYTDAQKFLEEQPYDFILSGDNHIPFKVTSGEKTLLNPGPIMRITTKDKEHQPTFYVLEVHDDHSYQIKEHPLKVKPWQEVFDLDEIKKKKEEELALFVNSMKEIVAGEQFDFNFLRNLRKQIDSKEEEILTEVLARIGGK